ncbi:MAG TPA: hypothetical protein VMT24_11950, partial [Aggregatilineaceae bacterium]|nr:hypothetical protein [Aggregatilineaceae bacterium]
MPLEAVGSQPGQDLLGVAVRIRGVGDPIEGPIEAGEDMHTRLRDAAPMPTWRLTPVISATQGRAGDWFKELHFLPCVFLADRPGYSSAARGA